MCLGFLSSLFGCKKDKYILDGPGMVNPVTWESISISQYGYSIAQDNFSIDITKTADGCTVSGSIIGDDGTHYEADNIPLPKKILFKLHDLDPCGLPDAVSTDAVSTDSAETDAEIFPIDLPLDQGSLSITVRYTDGRTVNKLDADDFVSKVRKTVLPCFKESPAP